MKRTTLFSVRLLAVMTLLMGALAAYALSGPVTSFTGTFEGIDARLNWELSSETGLQRFELWRHSAADPTFQKLATIQPNGSARYTFLDQNLYKTDENNNTIGAFTYKLVATTSSGDFNNVLQLSQTPSAVQRSWGSIKSMFR